MRVSRRAILFLGILPLAGCAVVGPVTDPNLTNAPYQACARFADAPAEAAPAAPPDAPQCVSVRLKAANGQWGAFNGTIAAGEELLALPSGTPQCAHNNYTHIVLEGSSDAGAMRIAVPDAFGRGDRGRSFAWRTPRSRWTADNIGTAQHLPAGARVMVSEGQVRLTSACFRSYVH
jgi:hypothetical protein